MNPNNRHLRFVQSWCIMLKCKTSRPSGEVIHRLACELSTGLVNCPANLHQPRHSLNVPLSRLRSIYGHVGQSDYP
jgi:hypothetical protein